MTAMFGEGYFCSCSDRDECNESCSIYRVRHEISDQKNMIQVSEAEYEEMSKAMLITMYLKDLLRMVEEIEDG